MFNRKVIAFVALGVAAIATTPAAAAETTASVSTDQLDLSTDKDVRTLDARLNRAVRDVCGVTPALRDIRDVRDYRACVVQARASYTQEREVAIARANDRARMAITERRSNEG